MSAQASEKPSWFRYLPFVVILAVAVIGYFALRDFLTFETLRDNREALLAFRDEARPDPQARFDTRAAKCTVLPLPNGELLVSARDTSSTLQALLPAQALPEVVAAWQMRR